MYISIRNKLFQAQTNLMDMIFYDSKIVEIKKSLAQDMMQTVSVALVKEFSKEIRAKYDTEYDRRRSKMMLAGEEPETQKYSMHPPGRNTMKLELYVFTHLDMADLLLDIIMMDKEELQYLVGGVLQDSKQYNLNFDRVFLTNEIL